MKNITSAGLGALFGVGLTLGAILFAGRREPQAAPDVFLRPIAGRSSVDAIAVVAPANEPGTKAQLTDPASTRRWAEPNTFRAPSTNPIPATSPLAPSDRFFREVQSPRISASANNGRAVDVMSHSSPVPSGGTEAPRFASITVQPSSVPGGPLNVEIGPGVLEPMAAIDSGEDTTPAQASALKNIVDGFAKEVQKAAASQASDEKLPAAWDAQKEQADSLYRILFGDAAFNQMSMEASIRAQADNPANP